MASNTYNTMKELENSMNKGLLKNESLDDKIIKAYEIISDEIDTSVEDENTKNYLKNNFLQSLSYIILKDQKSSKANFDMRREILLRIMNIGISELKNNNNNKMLSLFKQLFDISMPFYENEAKISKRDSYNFPKIISEKEFIQKIKKGDEIEYLSENKILKMWKRGKIDRMTESQFEIRTKSGKLKIYQKTCINSKLIIKGTYIQDSDWRLSLKKGDEIDFFYQNCWKKCTVMNTIDQTQNNKSQIITIGLGYYVNDNEAFLDTDDENRKYCGYDPKSHTIQKNINSTKILKPNSLTKEGLLLNETNSMQENRSSKWFNNDDEDITAYLPIGFSYNKFVMRKKERKSPSLMELLRNFHEQGGFDLLINKLKTYSAVNINDFINCIEIFSIIYFAFHRKYLKELEMIISPCITNFLMECAKSSLVKNSSIIERILNLYEALISRLNTIYQTKLKVFNLKMDILCLFFSSHNLEKTNNALTEIQSTLKAYEKRLAYSYNSHDSKNFDYIFQEKLIKYLIEKNILGEIFNPSGHSQLIQKTEEIVNKLISNKKISVLDIIWPSSHCNVHTKIEIYNLIKKIFNLSNQNILVILNKIKEMNSVTKYECELLEHLIHSRIISNNNQFVSLIFELILKVSDQSIIDKLINILMELSRSNEREEILDLIQKEISKNQFNIPLIKIIRILIEKATYDHYSNFLDTLRKFYQKFNPLSGFLNYIKNLDEAIFENRELKKKGFAELELLFNGCTNNLDKTLDVEYKNLNKELWNTLVISNSDESGIQLFFKFLKSQIDNICRIEDTNIEEIVEVYNFLLKMPEEKLKLINISEFQTIKNIFLIYFFSQKKIKFTQFTHLFSENYEIISKITPDLQLIWNIYESTSDESVAENAEQFIIEIINETKDTEAVENLLKKLFQNFKDFQISENLSQTICNRIDKYLRIIENLIIESEVSGTYVMPHFSQTENSKVNLQIKYQESFINERVFKTVVDSNLSIWELKKLIAKHLDKTPQDLEYSFQNSLKINSDKINSLPINRITEDTEMKVYVERRKYKKVEKHHLFNKKIRLTQKAYFLLSSIFELINSSGFVTYDNAEHYFKNIIDLKFCTINSSMYEIMKFAERRDLGLNEEEFKEYYKNLFLNQESEANSHFNKIKEFLNVEEEIQTYIQTEKIEIHMLPRFFLANSSDYFEILINLVNHKQINQNLKQNIWKLLLNLSTNKRLEFAIKGKYLKNNLADPLKLASGNIYLSTYILSIIEKIFLVENELNKKWIGSFFEKSGYKKLIESISNSFKNSEEIHFQFICKALKIVNLFLLKYLSISNYLDTKSYDDIRIEHGEYFCTKDESIYRKVKSSKFLLKSLELIDSKKLQKELSLKEINNILYLGFCYILDAEQNLKNEMKDVSNLIEMKKICEIAFCPLDLKDYLAFTLRALTQSPELAKVK